MKKIFVFIILLIAVCCGRDAVLAQEARYPLLAQSEYFSIYAYPEADTQQLLQKLNFNSFFQVDGLTLANDSPRDIVAKTFDAIYLEVSDTLGISVYSFEGKVKIFPNQAALNDEYRAIFHQDFSERAFYIHEKSTLYISLEDMTIGMMAHEMAHMIMSNYFIVPPSPKLQEILSGYVEYHFRKLLNMPIG